MNNLKFITKSANGKNIFNRFNSHIHKNVTEEVLLKALSSLHLSKSFHKEVVDMKHTIGKCNCIPINSNDEIVYVVRKGRKGPTPMVKGRTPIDCSCITLVLKKIEDDNYILLSSYIGSDSAPEPWDSNFYDQLTWEKKSDIDEVAYVKSIEFWRTHALIYDRDEISLLLS